MEVIILGSGTYQPEPERHPASFLMKVGKQILVFDFGRGALDQLLKLDVEYYDIDRIFISHIHSDHSSELGPFLHIALFEPEKGKFRKKDLTIYGPRGIKKTIYYLLNAFGIPNPRPPYKFEIKELIDSSVVRGQDWILKSYRAKHSENINSLCFRLESKGKITAYSGDTEDCPGLRKACKNADLAIIEATWPKELDPKGHMDGQSVGRVAQISKIKKLVLTHMAPYYLENFDIKKEAQKYFKGPVILAKDLMKIKI